MSTSNRRRGCGAFWCAVWVFAVLLCAAVALSILTGCAYQTSRWRDTPGGGVEYHQTNITPPFGRQAESAGQMSATVLDDGTWEIVIGRTDVGVDNAAQAEIAGKAADLLLMLGRLSAAGGM